MTSISQSLRPLPGGESGQGWSMSPTSSGCPPRVLRQVSDLVLIDPIPEDVFEEDQWKEYW